MIAPVYTTWADGTRLQRLDTLGLSWAEMIGVRVHHPIFQVGDDRCAWGMEEIFLLEEAIGMRPLSDSEKDEQRAEWPNDYPKDTGVVFEVFVGMRQHGSDLVRARFKEPDDDGTGLHYALIHLWVVVDAPKEAP